MKTKIAAIATQAHSINREKRQKIYTYKYAYNNFPIKDPTILK